MKIESDFGVVHNILTDCDETQVENIIVDLVKNSNNCSRIIEKLTKLKYEILFEEWYKENIEPLLKDEDFWLTYYLAIKLDKIVKERLDL